MRCIYFFDILFMILGGSLLFVGSEPGGVLCRTESELGGEGRWTVYSQNQPSSEVLEVYARRRLFQ